MSYTDHPYIDPESGEGIVPVVQVRVNGRVHTVSQEVVGHSALCSELCVPSGTRIYRERHGKAVGNPLGRHGHVFHAGDRYIALCPTTGHPVSMGAEEPV